MINRIWMDIRTNPWWRWTVWLIAALVISLLLAACSGSTPAPEPTIVLPPPTATEAVPPPTPTQTAPADTSATEPAPLPTVAPTVPAPIRDKAQPPPATATAPPPPPLTDAPTETPLVPDARQLLAISEASDEVYALLEELIAELGPRASASEEELRAAEFLKERYEGMGYQTEIQPFVFTRFDFARWAKTGGENANVTVESHTEMKFSGLPLTPSPNDAAAFGPLKTLDLSESDELPMAGLEGRVVHILFGDLRLDNTQVMAELLDQVNRLAEAGAVAVVFSRKLGEPSAIWTLDVEPPIPALYITRGDGWLLGELGALDEEVTVSVNIDADTLVSRNVVAELKGTGDDVVVLGAHYDTVPEGSVGANDNASGTAVILALAEALSGQSLPFTVRFVSFGAEEVGLVGSRHYVASLSDTELGRVKAMLNLDVVGSGEFTAMAGHRKLTGEAMKLAAELQLRAQLSSLPPGATSDHAPFEMADVPVLFLWAPDISRINSPRDQLEFVDRQRLGEAFLLAKALLSSPEFPPK